MPGTVHGRIGHVRLAHSLAALGPPEGFSGVVYGGQHVARPAVKLFPLVVSELLPQLCGLTPKCLEPSQVSQEHLCCGEGISDLVAERRRRERTGGRDTYMYKCVCCFEKKVKSR